MNVEQCVEKLTRSIGAENIRFDEPLRVHTTFKIGGPADVFVRPSTIEQAASAISICSACACPLYVLGKGSNLLVADQGVRGVVMQLSDNLSRIQIDDQGALYAEAGASNEDVARAAQAANLTGYEFASGIPGSIGGAATMNAGAYEGEFSQVATSLICATHEGKRVELSASEADWGYRHSVMADRGMVVLAATLQLSFDSAEAIQTRMDELASRRRLKQPLDMPSAGSTFKRPSGHFAGELIQKAGMQGYRVGGAEISTKHAGFVVNTGGATADDVLRVIFDVQDRVAEVTGVQLVPEVKMWGF